ncbi:MAG TPA: hypothetical protein DCY07_00915 [Rhodospirillaceae bacterium]|nr:hypothetical protein [Rhodospirillaceae bacterium]
MSKLFLKRTAPVVAAFCTFASLMLIPAKVGAFDPFSFFRRSQEDHIGMCQADAKALFAQMRKVVNGSGASPAIVKDRLARLAEAEAKRKTLCETKLLVAETFNERDWTTVETLSSRYLQKPKI